MATKKISTAVLVLAALAWSSLVFAGEIHDAAEKGDLKKVNSLLASDPSLVNARLPSNKATPLIFAITYQKPKVAKLLLEKGADVNARASNGHTALHYGSYLVASRVGCGLGFSGDWFLRWNVLCQSSIISFQWVGSHAPDFFGHFSCGPGKLPSHG